MTNSLTLLVGENSLFRQGLKQIIETEVMTVAAESKSLPDALTWLRSAGHSADLLIYDLSGEPAFDTMAEIAREFPKLGIIVLTDHPRCEAQKASILAGAKAFLPTDISSDALLIISKLVLLGECIFSSTITLIREQLSPSPERYLPGHLEASRVLSVRETAILDYLEDGLPNKTIARNLDIAEATVKVHLKSVLRKLNVQNRTQAAVWAMTNRSASPSSQLAQIVRHQPI